MPQNYLQNRPSRSVKRLKSLVLIALALGMAGSVPIAVADTYDDQINNIKAQSNAVQSGLNTLAAEADSYQGAINQLTASSRPS
jgi:hypothetical protein